MMQQPAGMFMEAMDLIASLQLEIGLLFAAVCLHLLVSCKGKKTVVAAAKQAPDAGKRAASHSLSADNRHETRLDPVQRCYMLYHDRIQSAALRSFQEVWAIVDEMTAAGSMPTHTTASIIMAECVKKQANPRDLERAVKMFDAVSTSVDAVALAQLVDSCLKGNRLDLLVPRLRRQQSTGSIQRMQSLTVHQYATIIRGFGASGDIKGAWDMWCSMFACRIAPSSLALGCMVEALVANGDVEAGFDLIREMQADPEHQSIVNGAVYGSVLKGYSHQQKIDRVWSVYQEMLESKVDFTIVTFNTLIDACSRSDEMGRIPILLEDMERLDITPDAISYGSILKGYCRSTRMNEAFQLLETMKQTTDITIDEVMYNTLIDGCSHQGLYDQGIEVLKQMCDAGIPPTNYTLSVLVKLCTRSNRPEEAFRLAAKISKEFKFQLNAHVYANLVNACTQNRNKCLPRALETFDRMVSEKVRPDIRTYTLLIRACIQDGERAKAEELLRYALGMSVKKCASASYPLRPAGKFPTELVSEVLRSLGGTGAELLRDVKALMPDIKLEASLQMRCMEKTLMDARDPCGKKSVSDRRARQEGSLRGVLARQEGAEQKPPLQAAAAPWRRRTGTC